MAAIEDRPLRLPLPLLLPALDRYRAKRDFAITPEPASPAPDAAATDPGAPLGYVIQQHAATRLHYDFRLEWAGVLLSWAVPKGPSLDPADKRMAVRTEDHPLAYATFQGRIPAGQYGAGDVIVWDRGSWSPVGDPQAGLAAGKLAFELHGHKLHGMWELVRMKPRSPTDKESWLLFKKRDGHARTHAQGDVLQIQPDSVLQVVAAAAAAEVAGVADGQDVQDVQDVANVAVPAPLPDSLTPQLALLATVVTAPGRWIYETKYDGYRLLARIEGGVPRLITRGGHDWTDRLAPLARALGELNVDTAWLDGEIVVPGGPAAAGGEFNALQNALQNAPDAGGGRGECDGDGDGDGAKHIRYMLFDLPYFEGHDLRDAPLYARRALLAQLLAGVRPPLMLSTEVGQGGGDLAPGLLQAACAAGREGLIAKQADAPYRSARNSSWLKLKCHLRQEFVIGGYTARSDDANVVGSLLLGVHGDDGRLCPVGSVGTGWNTATARSLLQKLRPLQRQTSPFDSNTAPGRWARAGAGRECWVRPTLVAEVRFAQWTAAKRIRHATFLALRTDKAARDITRELVLGAAAAGLAAAEPVRAATVTTSTSTCAAGVPSAVKRTSNMSSPKVTHGERVIDAASGCTKLDLVRYYDSVAEFMLPHLQHRPVALLRAPGGVGAPAFFQKHDGKAAIAGVRQLDPALWPGHEALLEVPTLEALVAAAQMNVIEFHTWNATDAHLDKPDRMIFDLDPGEGVTWEAVQEGALLTRALLHELGLQSWLKTSGGKGLHVVVPVAPRRGFDIVKAFSKAVVEHLSTTIPARFVAKSGAGNRVAKIFVDYLRNGEGATTVTAFSARARPGLGVSMPVAWEALKDIRSGAHWHVGNARDALSVRTVDPWAALAGTRQPLTAAMKTLGFKAPAASAGG